MVPNHNQQVFEFSVTICFQCIINQLQSYRLVLTETVLRLALDKWQLFRARNFIPGFDLEEAVKGPNHLTIRLILNSNKFISADIELSGES